MTVGIAYRVPGHGAVLAADGRMIDANNATIMSDNSKKIVVCGSVAVLVAGTLGVAGIKLEAAAPKTFAAFQALVAEHGGEDMEWLAYDRRHDRLHYGAVNIRALFSGVGCGAPIALGVVDALPIAKTLADAERSAVKAIRIACKHNAACGGRIRVLVLPKRGAPIWR